MKKFLLALLLTLVCGATANAVESKVQSDLCGVETTMSKVANVTDYQAVKNVINKYIEAGKAGKSSILRPYAHKDALMFGRTNGELTGGSMIPIREQKT